MSQLFRLHSELLNDNRITDDEVAIIRNFIADDGRLDLNDVKFLVGLLSSAQEVCPAFDELFFPILKEVLLDDGKIGLDEQYYLVKMLFSKGHIRDREREFLLELRDEADDVSPELEALCEEILAVPSAGWSVGGQLA
jgi:hypothetical protein